MGAVFGGRMPVPSSNIFGGITENISEEKIEKALGILNTIKTFTDEAYYPDLMKITEKFPEYTHIGNSGKNYMSFGGYTINAGGTSRLFEPGVILDGEYQPLNLQAITEDIEYSFYENTDETGAPGLKQTEPNSSKAGAYSWIKAPRYYGMPVETGPLARIVIGLSQGDNPLSVCTRNFLSAAGLNEDALHSVLGRHIGRAVECRLMCEYLETWLNALRIGESACTTMELPESASGYAVMEAPRGSLGHWIRIEDGSIANYQVISPTTWNASPRDVNKTPGPIEKRFKRCPR